MNKYCKKPGKKKDTEHLEQCKIIQWSQDLINAGKWCRELDLLHAIPNGGKRDIVTAAKLKNEGVKRGVPDLFLPVARGGYHGLYIELKIKGGKISNHQIKLQQNLLVEGYLVVNEWTAQGAILTITDYLDGSRLRSKLNLKG